MPAGSAGIGDITILNALMDFLERQGISFSRERLFEVYLQTKDSFMNADRDIRDAEGRITGDFITAIVEGLGGGGVPTPEAPEDIFEPPKFRDTGVSAAVRRNARIGFLSILQVYGIPLTGNLEQLVAEATNKGYNQQTFVYWLRQTPEYRDRFVGIFADDGTLKMTEAQYLRWEQQFRDIMATSGLNLSPSLQDWLFRNDVSPAVLAQRAPAVRALKENRDLFEQFQKALRQEGVRPEAITRQGLLRFVAGEGNREWMDVWNLARARYAATQAGITLSRDAERYLALNPRLIEKISGKGLSDAALAQGFEAVAGHLLETLPLSKIQGFGLSKRALVEAAFGGKRSAETRQKIERVLRTEAAFQEAERAAAPVTPAFHGPPRPQSQ